MREIIAVCRSRKAARDRVATVLDRYFWRIGDRTWRGKASNACLDRVARELRKKASRATAVSIQEIRSSSESRMPLIRIGSKAAFSEEGVAPVASHPSEGARLHGSASERNGLAVVRIAALFHDLGKATVLFQAMLDKALTGASAEASSIRHELHSAVVWDILFGTLDDRSLAVRLAEVTPEEIDAACVSAVPWILARASAGTQRLDFGFLREETRLTFAIGMLILTHHRLPQGETDHLGLQAGNHVVGVDHTTRAGLQISAGVPFWHEAWWRGRLAKDAATLVPGQLACGLDIALRGSLVFADHIGSSEKAISAVPVDFLANTMRDAGGDIRAADSLSQHIRRVYLATRPAFDLLNRLRDRLPGLDETQLPLDLVRPVEGALRFLWQVEAARAASTLTSSAEGGFFACLMAGTGTGKTRAAPTILANAAFGDKKAERRYFRMTLGLGLRVLATQSANEYQSQLGLNPQDVQVLVGAPVIEFPDDGASIADYPDGSESLSALPEWLRLDGPKSSVPEFGADAEADWLRGLSHDTDRGIPAILAQMIKVSGKKAKSFATLATTPVLIATVDHLMGVAAPIRSAFLPAAIRTLTSDLILDEIDQYGPEDIAALARLVFQTAAGGRRVIIMSATLTADVASALHAAYRAGWSNFAATGQSADHVHVLLTGDAPGSIITNAQGEDFPTLYDTCRKRILAALSSAPVLRHGRILPPCRGWKELVAQIEEGCHEMHALNAVETDGFRISVGLVRMTRISHATALFSQLSARPTQGRLRVTLCLHSNMPRLHRAWVENRMKKALTRKGTSPQEGIRDLCTTEGIFARAAAMEAHDIEIVCVTSPVIETGNDLDFDYAILDPISIRSIVQAAGRVRRHRMSPWDKTNTLILGRSPVAMESGALARPGVESDLPRITAVSRANLSAFPDRHFGALAGSSDFDRVDATPILTDELPCPLRDAETDLRRAMLSLSGENAPLGRYLERTTARMNDRFTQTRVFRRSTTRMLELVLSGDDLETAIWKMNNVPKSSPPNWIVPKIHEVNASVTDGTYVFHDILSRSLADLGPQDGISLTAAMRRLVSLDLPDYGSPTSVIPVLTYGEQTGFTRNLPDDLSAPYGKSTDNQ